MHQLHSSDNLELYGDEYYQRRTLSYTVGETEELWGRLAAAAGAAAGAARQQQQQQ